MARRSPDEAILTAIVTTLKATTALTALATGGIYNNVPQETLPPYVEVTAPSARREDTFGRFGASTLLDVKSVSQAFGDQEGLRIRDQVIRALNDTTPTSTGHAILGIAWDQNDRMEDVVNGTRTRYHIASFRVWTEQSSS